MKKRFSSLTVASLIAALVVLLLAACGSSTATGSGSLTPTTTTSASTPAATPTTQATPVATPTLTLKPCVSTVVRDSTPEQTLQSLCNTLYAAQWSLFTADAQSGYWQNDSSVYVTGLQSRDKLHKGVTKWEASNLLQYENYLSGEIVTTFSDGTKDVKTCHLRQEGGVWKIYLIF